MDVTYGKGNFWTSYRPARLICHDLALDGVDFRQLPEEDASVARFDACHCPCHQVIQPGLVPCPRCDPEADHSSR